MGLHTNDAYCLGGHTRICICSPGETELWVLSKFLEFFMIEEALRDPLP